MMPINNSSSDLRVDTQSTQQDKETPASPKEALITHQGKIDHSKLISYLKFARTDEHPLHPDTIIPQHPMRRAYSEPTLTLNKQACIQDALDARPRSESEPLTKVAVKPESSTPSFFQRCISVIKGKFSSLLSKSAETKQSTSPEVNQADISPAAKATLEGSGHTTSCVAVGAHKTIDQKLMDRATNTLTAITKLPSAAKEAVKHLWSFAKGKAKQLSTDGLYAFATPIKASKEAEVREDYLATKEINTKLLTLDLTALLGKINKFTAPQVANLTQRVTANFNTMQQLVDILSNKKNPIDAATLAEALNANPPPSSNPANVVTTEDAQTLITLLTAPEHQQEVERMCRSGENLQLDIEEAAPHESIGGKFTLKMGLAGNIEELKKKPELKNLSVEQLMRRPEFANNLEDLMRKPEFTQMPFAKVLDLCAQIANGLKDLHRIGIVHGDLKPENILFYIDAKGNIKLKIADWGKKKVVPPGENAKHTGNPRYAPPEGRISTQGEVFSGGAIMTRLLEEWGGLQGNETMMLQPENISRYAELTLTNKRRGFEEYLCKNADCPQKDTLLRAFEQRVLANPTSSHRMATAEVAAHKYIDALAMRLLLKVETQTTRAEEQTKMLKQLLKAMLQSTGSNRPDMASVSKTLSAHSRAAKGTVAAA